MSMVSFAWTYAGSEPLYPSTDPNSMTTLPVLTSTTSAEGLQQQLHDAQLAMATLQLQSPHHSAPPHSSAPPPAVVHHVAVGDSMTLQRHQQLLVQQNLQLQQQHQQQLHHQHLLHQQQQQHYMYLHYMFQQQQQGAHQSEPPHSAQVQQEQPAGQSTAPLVSAIHTTLHYPPPDTSTAPTPDVLHIVPYIQHYPLPGYEAYLHTPQPLPPWPSALSTYPLSSYPATIIPTSSSSTSSSLSTSSSPPPTPLPVLPSPPNAKLIVRYLPTTLTPTQFHRLFASLGPTLLSSNLIFHRTHRTSLGYGFLLYPTLRDARKVQRIMHGRVMEGGRPITVQECRTGVGVASAGGGAEGGGGGGGARGK